MCWYALTTCRIRILLIRTMRVVGGFCRFYVRGKGSLYSHPANRMGQSEVNWHLLPSASPLSLCLHTVCSGFCLYRSRVRVSVFRPVPRKNSRKRELEKSKESSRRIRKSNHVKMFVYFSKSKEVLKKR